MKHASFCQLTMDHQMNVEAKLSTDYNTEEICMLMKSLFGRISEIVRHGKEVDTEEMIWIGMLLFIKGQVWIEVALNTDVKFSELW